MAKQYDVIVLAGDSREPNTQGLDTGPRSKALLPIAGQPMLSYVIAALYGSQRMRRLILVGLAEGDLPGVPADLAITYVPGQGSIVDNALAAIDRLDRAGPVILCGSDIPLLTPQAVSDLLNRSEASGADLCYPIVSREVMEARFPGSGRSFRQLVDGEFCGGDLSLVDPRVVRENAAFFRAVTSNRKSAWGLAKAMGLGIILRFLTHRLHIHDLESRASKVLHCRCQAIPSTYAELGMDVDKPQHLQVVLRAMGGTG